MPVKACGNGKWRIGSGKCMYKSKAAAVRAYKAYLAKNPGADETDIEENGIPDEIEPKQDSVGNAIRRAILRRLGL